MGINWGEVLVATISVVGSAIVSFCISQKTAKAEIEKLKAIWAHEKESAYDADFDEMIAAVSAFVKTRTNNNFTNSVAKVAAYRSKATGELATIVDKLNSLLDRNSLNYDEIDKELTIALKCKREKG